jgi:hypothetical protein
MGGGWVVSTMIRPLYPREKTRYPLYRRLVGPQGPVWTSAENLANTGIRSPDRPARSESLYLLRYTYYAIPAPTHLTVVFLIPIRRYVPTKEQQLHIPEDSKLLSQYLVNIIPFKIKFPPLLSVGSYKFVI